jgi:hypothetical protein
MQKYIIICGSIILLIVSGTLLLKWDEWFTWPKKRESMRSFFKDPQSMQYRNQHSNGYYLCGEVNAKNAMGGYVGFEKFISYEDGFAVRGSTTNKFTSKSDSTDELVWKLGVVARLTRESGRNPTDQELSIEFFNRLWSQYCVKY